MFKAVCNAWGLAAAALTLSAPALVHAGVNPKNGGFYISYRDAAAPARGGLVLQVERTYNSLSSYHRGWFGNGWGTLFETRLGVLPEGGVAVQEIGSGSIVYYQPANRSAVDSAAVDAAVERLVQAALREDGAQDVAALRTRLRHSQEARWYATMRGGLETPVAVGTLFQSDLCPQARVERTAAGFERRNCNRTLDRFDAQGRLREREAPSGALLRAHYEAEGQGDRPVRLSHSEGGHIDLAWNAQRLVVRSTLGEVVTGYTYSDLGSLVRAQILDGPQKGMWYAYEHDAHHNITAIRYPDDTALRLRYNDAQQVQEEISRTDETTRYTYFKDPQDPGVIGTRIHHTDYQGRVSEREVVFRMAQDDAGAQRTTYVGESSGGGAGRSHTMDERGRVVVKAERDGSLTRYIYHPRTDKLIIAMQAGRTVMYHYNDAGEMVRAHDDAGREVELAYDAKGQILRMTEVSTSGPRRDFSMQYNAQGRLSRIALRGVGHAEVHYGKDGEIDKVHSEGGARMSSAITGAFYQLLSLVKAGT